MKVYFDTLGCMKNQDDSDMAMGILEKAGHTHVSDPADADVIIVNTCGFIEPAKRESIDEIFDMASYREQGKKILVSGCLVQRYAEDLFKEIGEVDGMIGVNDYEKLPAMLDRLEQGERVLTSNGFDQKTDAFGYAEESKYVEEGAWSAYLRISEGCDRNCAYCAIPAIRGPYRSKPMDSILREASMLAGKGVKELVVIAEDTGLYGFDLYGKPALAELLQKLCGVEGIRWIRLMYCYEDNITPELVDVIASEEKICKYIDIPLQHASDRVLKRMRRKTTRKEIEEKIAMLREKIPGIAVRTTFITGFPGETEEDVACLMDFIRKERFARMGVFAFSREEGTPAYDMDGQVPDDVKEERRDALMLEQLQISNELNRELIGKTMDVLVEEAGEDGSCSGRTRFDAPDIDDGVIFTAAKPHRPGDIVKVTIEDAFDYDITGKENVSESTK